MKIGIVQKRPKVNQLEACISDMSDYIAQAKAENVDIVVFGECWLCGYAAWMDYASDAGYWDHAPVKEAWAEMYHNSIDVKSTHFQTILDLAKEAGIYLIIGANEKISSGPGNGSLFNSIFTISKQGVLLNHHRKLMPTYTEKLIHGLGDGYGLNGIETEHGRIGSLICWEHWMPLTRQAMHDEGEDFHFALWPYVKEMHIIASRQYAFEGRCFVISVGQMLRLSDTPHGLDTPKADHDAKVADPWMLKGGSCIIQPDGSFLLEPQYGNDEIIYQEMPDKDSFTGEKMNLAVSGHYQRPDVFELKVNKTRYY